MSQTARWRSRWNGGSTLGSIVAEATDADIALAVDRAAERVARRVRDALDRSVGYRH